MDDKTRVTIMKMAMELCEKGFTVSKAIEATKCLYPKQPKETIDFIVKSAIDMIVSFDIAVDKAGGSGWPLEELFKMTFLDLVSRLATNHVRFVCDKAREIK